MDFNRNVLQILGSAASMWRITMLFIIAAKQLNVVKIGPSLYTPSIRQLTNESCDYLLSNLQKQTVARFSTGINVPGRV
eukprot:snap_masked-scaffold_22-processed-gene-1.3-mRNA-1 protein AED:1.00 eAED:1.00 QI:0/0/0/0/1/1/3/0/78